MDKKQLEQEKTTLENDLRLKNEELYRLSIYIDTVWTDRWNDRMIKDFYGPNAKYKYKPTRPIIDEWVKGWVDGIKKNEIMQAEVKEEIKTIEQKLGALKQQSSDEEDLSALADKLRINAQCKIDDIVFENIVKPKLGRFIKEFNIKLRNDGTDFMQSDIWRGLIHYALLHLDDITNVSVQQLLEKWVKKEDK